MTDLEKAKLLLKAKGHTIVLCRDEVVYTSDLTGIKPMVKFIDDGIDLRGFAVADLIVGKAAAMLFSLAGIKEAYGEVMSTAAKEVLINNGIFNECKVIVPMIINRKQDGPCPMEIVTKDVDDNLEAFEKIKAKLKELNS